MGDNSNSLIVIFICVLHVIYAHPCGENPMRVYMELSRLTGRDVEDLVGILETANPSVFERIENEWKNYAKCVGMVDNGYFKRSPENKRDFVDEKVRDSSSWFLNRLYSNRGVNEKKRDLSNENKVDNTWLFKKLNPKLMNLSSLHHSRLNSDPNES